MIMNGEKLYTIEDLKRCFSIDELIYSYYSGELEMWLEKIGETEKALQVGNIRNNALLLVRLYQIFGLEYEMSEENIREMSAE
ncbi:MAG: hypothetical protein K2I06_10080 [Ruminococcus sp.]|nr:hypothetical protein [Ruminococcus sp.]